MELLKFVLRINAASCLIFGALFVAAPKAISSVIGNSYPWAIVGLGLGLLAYSLHLMAASRRAAPKKLELAYFILGDYLWAVGTLILIGLGVAITTTTGIVAAIGIAGLVGTLGTLQLLVYRKFFRNN